MKPTGNKPLFAIACGGTGGHLFPGLAVGEELVGRGFDVVLLVSPKEVDQQAVKGLVGMSVETLPAVALTGGGMLQFLVGSCKSYRKCRQLFAGRRPCGVLAMGGFTSAPPVIAGRMMGIPTFLHESNSVAGRANRLISRFVREGYIYFADASKRLRCSQVKVTGMPVRSQFHEVNASGCRIALGLNPDKPVVLVMGGSQGASGVNDLVLQVLPKLQTMAPELQFIHLTGTRDYARVKAAYGKNRAVVEPFMTEMELAMGAASVAISRAGASSLAEIAAMKLPSVLVPYPTAADNHQYFNARALVDCGAARLAEQATATPDGLIWVILELANNPVTRGSISSALATWHFPRAASEIADAMLAHIPECRAVVEPRSGKRSRELHAPENVMN